MQDNERAEDLQEEVRIGVTKWMINCSTGRFSRGSIELRLERPAIACLGAPIVQGLTMLDFFVQNLKGFSLFAIPDLLQ